MTEQMIPAADIRAWRDKYRGCTGNNALQALDALLPAPPPPTLADMPEDERAACQWMQADIIGGDEPLVITRIDQTYWSALILDRNGRYDEVPAKHVTPRPDLPRFVWPGDTPAPAPIAQEDYPPRDQLTQGAKWDDLGTLEEALSQRGEAAHHAIVLDDAGEVYVWEADHGGRWMVRYPVQRCGPFRLILNDQEADQ